jgi:hypothetical protein
MKGKPNSHQPLELSGKIMHPKLEKNTLLMSTHTSVLVDSVGPPSAEVCRTAASFP